MGAQQRLLGDARQPAKSPLGANANATQLFIGDRVLAAANDACAFACSSRDGRLLWRTLLDGPCIDEVMPVGGLALFSTRASYWLCMETGAVRYRWSGPTDGTPLVGGIDREGHTVCGDIVLVPIRTGDHSGPGLLVAIRKGDVLYERETPRHTAYGFRPETGLAYESALEAISVLDLRSGRRLVEIRWETEAIPDGPACVLNGVIYQFAHGGLLYALRHPAVPKCPLITGPQRGPAG